MGKLGVVITDGVGFRNFILSDFLVQAQQSFDEVVILSCLPKEVYAGFVNCKVVELEVFEETFKTWLFRKAKEVAHLQLHKKDNFGIQDNLKTNYSKSKSIRGWTTRRIFEITKVFHSEKSIQQYNKWQQCTFKNNKITQRYHSLLKDEKFDILFFTHQRPPFIAPLVFQAMQLKIKTAAFIFSWDNLGSKGRMTANFDYYLVWSDLMKTELLQFYSTVQKKDIAVVGTPQFEPYVLNRYETSSSEFVNKFGLNPALKTICFSCGDISTSKNDELYIETIANAILDNKIPKVNFLVRTSPAEGKERFQDLASKFSFIKWNFPKWNLSRDDHQETWSQRIPTVEDLKDLRAILCFSDLNINMLSTMSLDFMQFGKPVINTVFGNATNGLYDDQRFFKYAHIEKVIESKATRVVTNQQELIDSINNYLENPNLDCEYRSNLVQLQVSKPLKDTGKRIAETLKQWT